MHLSLPRRFPLFSFFCLLVSPVSDFCPNTRRGIGGPFSFFFRLTCSVALRGGRDATNNTGVCSQCLSHAGPAPACCAHAHTTQALRCSAGNHLRPALGCMYLPGLSRSGSALRQHSEVQIRLGLRFVPFPGPSGSGVWRVRLVQLMTFSCCSVFRVYQQRPLSGRW